MRSKVEAALNTIGPFFSSSEACVWREGLGAGGLGTGALGAGALGIVVEAELEAAGGTS